MITIELISQKTSARQRTFVIGIHREGKLLLVRKSEIIAGIRVPLDETYVLDIAAAICMQQYWINELHGFSLN